MAQPHITTNAAGHPRIAGTELTVASLLQALATSPAVDALVSAHPDVDRAAVQAALAHAVTCVQGPVPPAGLSWAQAVGEFVPQTPLAARLWARRQAVIREALERGEPLLHDWEDVRQAIQERRGEQDDGDAC